MHVHGSCPIVGSREHNNGKRDGKRSSQSIRAPLPRFRHERFKVSLLAADVNLFMPTVIFCSAIRYFPRYSGPPIAAKIADSGAG